MKKCITCNIVKEETEFYKRSNSSKTQNECKACWLERQNRRRQNGAPQKKHLFVCSKCGKEEWLLKNTISRKKNKDLCGSCAQQKNYQVNNLRVFHPAKDWNKIYNDSTQTGNTLEEARIQGLKYYKRECSKHGPMPYATLDQSCRKCSAECARTRNEENIEFNRPRTILSAARKRSRERGLMFDLTIEDIRGNIPTMCPILDIPLSYDHDFDTSPSLDRLDSTKGYTKENVKIISNRANRLKNNGNAIEHLQIALWQLKEQELSRVEIEQYIKEIIEENEE